MSSDLKHHTISGYLKLTHKIEKIDIGPPVLYYDLAGVHFFTWEKGSTSSHSMFYPEANWEKPNHKESPSHLLKKMYTGLLVNIEFTNTKLITPSFEVRFLPYYGEYKGNTLNPLELAINLSFGKHK